MVNKIFRRGRRYLESAAKGVLASGYSQVLSYDDSRKSVMELILRVRSECGMVMEKNEAYQLYSLARNTAKVPGDIAEVGTYTGGSSKLICEAKGNRPLHLFDTFEGLPPPTNNDVRASGRSHFYSGMYSASLESVQEYLKDFSFVFYYKGLFPATATPVEARRFSFVHLDVDLYQSTKDCIEFFYPRMSRGGVILSHDYINASGVRRAFDDFFQDKPEPLIELGGSQVCITKL